MHLVARSNGNGESYYIMQGKSRRRKGNSPRKEYQDYLGMGISVKDNVFYKKHKVIKYDPKGRDEDDYTEVLTSLGYSLDTVEDARLAWKEYTASKEKAAAIPPCPQAPICGIKYTLNRDEKQTSGLTAMAERGLKSVSFGSTFLLDELMRGIEYDDVLAKIGCVPINTIKSLVAFKFSDDSAYSLAEQWYYKDIASYFFSGANLSSQAISRTLETLGDETVALNFLFHHVQFIKNIYGTNKIKINIDSTPFDNKCAVYISRYYSHANKMHHGFRLLVVVHIPTGLPVYYQIIHGNIVDQSTLQYVTHILSRYGLDITQIVADAGYFNISSIENLLFIEDIDFTTRLNRNYSMFKNAIDNNLEDFYNDSEVFRYKNRIIHAKKIKIDLTDQDLSENKCMFLYLFEDDTSKRVKMDNAEKTDGYATKSCDEILNERRKYGKFAIISTKNLSFIEILNEYFSRMNIEEYFDVLKNELDALPVRLHNVKTIRGHILISFIASFFYILIKHRLSLFDCNYLNINPKYENDNILEPDPANIKSDIIKQPVIEELVKTPFKDILYELKQHDAFVCTLEEQDKSYNDLIKEIVPSPVHKQARIVYEAFGLLAPFRILVENNNLNYIFNNILPKGNTKELAFSDKPCKHDLDILNSKKDKNESENVTTDEQSNAANKQTTNTNDSDQLNNDKANKSTDIDTKGNSQYYNTTHKSQNIDINNQQINKDRIKQKTNKIDKRAKRSKSKDISDQKNLEEMFDKFDNFFDFWDEGCHKNKQGRPKGSLNRKTIDKNFNKFDNFFEYWDEGWSKNKQGRPKGKLNMKTIVKLVNKFDDFFNYWDPEYYKQKPGRPKGSKNKKTLFLQHDANLLFA